MTSNGEALPDTDTYYLGIALAVRAKANCTGNRIGAVAVFENRVISTGYNEAHRLSSPLDPSDADPLMDGNKKAEHDKLLARLDTKQLSMVDPRAEWAVTTLRRTP